MIARNRFSPRRKVLLVAVLLLMAAMVALRLMGIAGFNGTEPRLSPTRRISSTSSGLSGVSATTPASSARLSSTGRADSPGSCRRVGATQATASWARFQAQASCSGVR